MAETIWDETQQEQNSKIADKNVSEVRKQTVFLMEILKQIGESIQENKSVTVENIVRQVVGKVAIERPDWISELKADTKPIEKKLDYIASAIIRKEVIRKMDFNRPDWIKELIPKEIEIPEAQDFTKPTVDILKEILIAINEKEITEQVEVTNAIEIKEPKWWKLPDIAGPIVSLAEALKKYFDKTTIKVQSQDGSTVKIENPVTEVTIKNPVKEVEAKGVVTALKLISAQLIAIGNTGSNGGQSAISDPLIEYKSAGMDISGTPMYFGYVATDGSWYIKALDTTSGTTYCKGDSNYATAWTGRVGLTYDLFNVIFG